MFKFGDKSKEAYCEYKCSKYCELYDIDGMSKLNNKHVCKACYNCAKLNCGDMCGFICEDWCKCELCKRFTIKEKEDV